MRKLSDECMDTKYSVCSATRAYFVRANIGR